MICFLFTWIAYQRVNVADLKYLLYPVASWVSLITGIVFEWQADVGFFSQTARIIIDKSCSGGQFFLLSTGILLFSFLPQLSKYTHQLFFVCLCTSISLLATIVANTARITMVIFFQELGYFEELLHLPGVHLAIGVLVYLSALFLLYLFMQHLFFDRHIDLRPTKTDS